MSHGKERGGTCSVSKPLCPQTPAAPTRMARIHPSSFHTNPNAAAGRFSTSPLAYTRTLGPAPESQGGEQPPGEPSGCGFRSQNPQNAVLGKSGTGEEHTGQLSDPGGRRTTRAQRGSVRSPSRGAVPRLDPASGSLLPHWL